MKPPVVAASPRIVLIAAVAFVGCAPHAEAPSSRPPPPPRVTTDCPDCPRMVAIPGGAFMMGSPADEPGRRKSEAPPHRVEVPAFAVGETEVTRGQYAVFARDANLATVDGCDTQGDGTPVFAVHDAAASWRHAGFLGVEQTDAHPVVCVSWFDAQAYVAWLSRRTGHAYRLLREAEFEYVARAGTTTAYFWGDEADRGCAYMNGSDPSLVQAMPTWLVSVADTLRQGDLGARLLACTDGAAFTAPVAHYKPNPFGLYDIVGNVWEWVEDCASDAVAADPRAPVSPGCPERRTRGGSWDDFPYGLRSARRARAAADARRNDTGFRVARALLAGESTR